MIQTDFRIPEELGPWVYFDRIFVFILEEGYKGWLEGATHVAETQTLDPIFDPRPQGPWRGVHGYVAFGQEGALADFELPGSDLVTSYPIWHDCQFINWKQSCFLAPRQVSTVSKGETVLHAGCNALRVWLRPNVRAYVKWYPYEIDPWVSGAKLLSPTGGGQIYPPVPFNSHIVP